MIKHILIIPDGNRRYAKKKNIDLAVVYKYISDDITTKLIKYLIIEKKVEEISFFAISRNNVLKRKKSDLQSIFDAQVESYQIWNQNKALTDNIKFKFVGDLSTLPEYYIKAAKALEEKTKKNKNGICNLLVAYDGNWEVLEAAKKVSQKGPFTLENFEKHLEISHIDLIIRTGGEHRLSGAPIWQSQYSELYFSEKFYPELTTEELEKVLKNYNERERRFGK